MASKRAAGNIIKAIFAQRLRKAIDDKGWSQSELARAAQPFLPKGQAFRRDNISVYLAGKALPRPKQLNALAKALNVKPDALLPGGQPATSAISYSMQPMPGHPGQSHLLVDMKVPMRTALKVLSILDGTESGNE